MEFYDGSSAKVYARNKTRIIKEINAIEATVAESVDDNLFECDVTDTVMTDTRDYAEPIKEAEAHCIMELDTVTIPYLDTYLSNNGDGNENNELLIDGGNAQQVVDDEVFCGYAPDFIPDNYIATGYADPTIQKSGNFRVGEVLVVAGRNDANPIEIKVTEVDDHGCILDVEIISRGEIEDKIFNTAELIYKDLDNWLDLYSDYGQISDLRIARDGAVYVKDTSDLMCDDVPLNTWQSTADIYKLGSLPASSFGEMGDVYTISGSNIYIKLDDVWVARKQVHSYENFRLPMDYGIEGTVCYNVFGNSYVKTACGWAKVKHIYELGDAYRPRVFDYEIGDIVKYNQVFRNTDGSVKKVVARVIYKCCSKTWKDILVEEDWKDLPSNEYGDDLDLFIYPNNSYKAKINGAWVEVGKEYRFDSLYLDDTFGREHDVITYNGEIEVGSAYVKMKANEIYPNGHWTKVEKVWDLNKYLLGDIPQQAIFTWTVKSIVLDKKGDGYIYVPTVSFSNGNAVANAGTLNDRVSDVVLVYGGDNYTDELPTIDFQMVTPSLSKKYYQVWKQTLENDVMQDEMEQVIEYFENTKQYTISRVSNDDGETFHWHVKWS
jgi:hypothetical protein